jgi:hypothetical protein
LEVLGGGEAEVSMMSEQSELSLKENKDQSRQAEDDGKEGREWRVFLKARTPDMQELAVNAHRSFCC